MSYHAQHTFTTLSLLFVFKLKRREEKELEKREKEIEERLKKSQEKLANGEKPKPGAKRKQNKGFNLQGPDPVSLAWYDDRTGMGAVQGPENTGWQTKR